MFDGIKKALFLKFLKATLIKYKETPVVKFMQNKKSFMCWAVVIVNTAIQIANHFGFIHVNLPPMTNESIDLVFGTLGIGSRMETQARMDAMLAELATLKSK